MRDVAKCPQCGGSEAKIVDGREVCAWCGSVFEQLVMSKVVIEGLLLKMCW